MTASSLLVVDNLPNLFEDSNSFVNSSVWEKPSHTDYEENTPDILSPSELYSATKFTKVTAGSSEIITYAMSFDAGVNYFIAVYIYMPSTSASSSYTFAVSFLGGGSEGGIAETSFVKDSWVRLSSQRLMEFNRSEVSLIVRKNGGLFLSSGDIFYMAFSQLHIGEEAIPYSETTSGVSYTGGPGDPEYIVLEPDLGSFKDLDKRIEDVHRVRDGGQYIYKWGDYKAQSMDVSFVNSSFKSTVNSWWGGNEKLLLVENFSSSINSVMIRNPSEPIVKLIKPYDNLFRGSLLLESY